MCDTARTIRVVIADDHPIIIEGIRSQLATHPFITVVGTAISFPDLLDLLRNTNAHIVILDLLGMQAQPIVMVERLRRNYPELAIVVFSSIMYQAPELVRAGVLGFIAKEEQPCHLLAALRAARRGEAYLGPAVQAYMEQAEGVRQLADLSEREVSVLKLLAQRLRTEEIAAQLSIDPRTAQNYITSLRRKTGSAQRIDLIDWYQRMFAGDP